MSKSGSKIREQVAHFLVDIHNPTVTSAAMILISGAAIGVVPI